MKLEIDLSWASQADIDNAINMLKAFKVDESKVDKDCSSIEKYSTEMELDEATSTEESSAFNKATEAKPETVTEAATEEKPKKRKKRATKTVMAERKRREAAGEDAMTEAEELAFDVDNSEESVPAKTKEETQRDLVKEVAEMDIEEEEEEVVSSVDSNDDLFSSDGEETAVEETPTEITEEAESEESDDLDDLFNV